MNTLYSERKLKLNRRNLDKALRGVCSRLRKAESSEGLVAELRNVWHDFNGLLFFDTLGMDGLDLFSNIEEVIGDYRTTVDLEEWIEQHQTLRHVTRSFDFVTKERNEEREF